MTSWFSTGRPEIIEAVVTACGRVDEAIQQDLESAKEKLEQAQKERDENLLRIAQLKAENDRLNELLRQTEAKAAQAAQSRSISLSSNPSSTANEVPTENEPNWKAECARVSSKFNALSENFRKAKDALRKRKDERDKWAEYSELLEKKIKAAEEEYGMCIIEKSNRNNRATTNLEVKTEANPSPNTSFVSDAGLDQDDLELPPLAAASLCLDRDSHTDSKKAANPLSESTQGESETRGSDDLPELPLTDGADEVQIKEAPSSDQPFFVSERAVKKRKRDEPELSETPIRKIKTEPGEESSPVISNGEHVLDLQESIDLGEVAQKMATPKKRREPEPSARGEQDRHNVFEAGMVTPIPLYVRLDPNPQPQTARPPARNSALTPLSVNRRVIQSGGDKPRVEKPLAPLRRGLSHGISSLAEDGGVYKKDAPGGHRRGGEKAVPKGRLDALLNSRSISDDESLTRSPRPRARASLADDLPIPGRRELPFEREKRARDSSTNQQANLTSKSSIARSRLPPQDTRSPLAGKGSAGLLRNKPPSDLRPDDFKINPLANEGHDFAYTDVVRDKDSRAELSGCTDMHCCGKNWRAMAVSQRPNQPLTPAQRQEEQKLLENYLGNVSYRLSYMSKEEKDELWIEAKMQELADKYGKHRHRYSRMQSPPGFWNPDFPTTQELDAERAEAAKREKHTVQERYREAMRPGGRWIFRDEQEERGV